MSVVSAQGTQCHISSVASVQTLPDISVIINLG